MHATAEPVSFSALRASLGVRVMVSRLRRRFMAVTAADDISPAQASILARIGRAEVATAIALAAAEGVRPQSMSAVLAQLEQAGLIVRTPDPADGRRQLIELTPAGRERLEGARQARAEWLAIAFQAEFTEEERQVIIEAMTLLEKLVN